MDNLGFRRVTIYITRSYFVLRFVLLVPIQLTTPSYPSVQYNFINPQNVTKVWNQQYLFVFVFTLGYSLNNIFKLKRIEIILLCGRIN